MPYSSVNDLSAFGAHAPGGVMSRLIAATRKASSTWAGKRLAFFLRGLGVKALRGRPADVESLGARMRLYPFNNITEKRILFTPQYFDPDELAYLAAKIAPDFVFVDVGANVGGYSLFVAARSGPTARIIAIEPQPDIHERLVYNIRQNHFATIKTLECAVADCEGDVTMFVDSRNRGESSMRIVPSRDGGRIAVRARKLADIVAAEHVGRIDAMKLDCEGAEDLIREPYVQNAPRAVWPEALIVEHMPGRWSMDLRAYILEQGYREALQTRQNIIFERDDTGQNR